MEWEWSELDNPFEGSHAHVTVAFSRDGKLLAAGANDTIGVWSLETRKQIVRMKLPKSDGPIGLAFTAEDKQLVSNSNLDPLMRFWDIKTGKQLREHDYRGKSSEKSGKDGNMVFSPNGRFAINKINSRGIEKGSLDIVSIEDGKSRPAAMDKTNGYTHSSGGVAFSPSGKTFCFNSRDSELLLFQTESGKLLRELRARPRNASVYTCNVGFSMDGRYILASEPGSDYHNVRPAIWGAEDGKKYCVLDKWYSWIGPGNRYALGDLRRVHDLLTDEIVTMGNLSDGTHLEVPYSPPRILCGISPDGGTFVFHDFPVGDRNGQANKRVLFISPAPILPPPIRIGDALTADVQRKLWSGVVADNLFRRQHCTRVLSAKPEEAVQLAKVQLKPVPEADAERLNKLIVQLNDDALDVREKSQTELQQLGRYFEESVIAKALAAAPPGEVRNRLTSAARKIAEAGPPVELTADLRAVEFLKQLDSAAAREHLKALAAGAKGALLTAEAAAALAGK